MATGTDSEDEERRKALRLPKPSPSEGMPDDSGDPLGGGDRGTEIMDAAQFRVKRRAEAGEYSKQATSRSLPLIALAAQFGFGSIVCLAFGFCYVLRSEADLGSPWAVDALANSDSWYPGWCKLIFDQPPGGPLTLLYAAANGFNALRCLPLLFDRVLVARLPNSETWRDVEKRTDV